MKRRALGSFCVLNIIASIGIILFFLYFIGVVESDYVTLEYDGFLLILVYFICIIVALQRLFRVLGCYYVLEDNRMILRYITIRRREKWYDFMAIGRKLNFTYQKEYIDVSYDDVVSIDYMVDKKINVYFWKKKEVAIKLKNGRYIWLVKTVFNNKQLREIVEYVKEMNSKVEISDNIKNYLNLT